MRIGLKYITPMLAAGAAVVAIGAAPIAAAEPAPAQPATIAAPPWRRPVGTAAVGTAAVGTAVVGTAAVGSGVGGLGPTRGAGAGERPIARKALAVVAASAATTCAGATQPPADRWRNSAPAGAEAAAAANRGDLGFETTRV